jgi:hypothetical protein
MSYSLFKALLLPNKTAKKSKRLETVSHNLTAKAALIKTDI